MDRLGFSSFSMERQNVTQEHYQIKGSVPQEVPPYRPTDCTTGIHSTGIVAGEHFLDPSLVSPGIKSPKGLPYGSSGTFWKARSHLFVILHPFTFNSHLP